MIKLEKTDIYGWEAAIRGMRNPKNSWEKSDSENGCELVTGSYERCRSCAYRPDYCGNTPSMVVGPNDYNLMMRLAKGGSVHAKYRRMIVVTVDITAPLYWWKEFDTYKVGTVADSCSTMHKIHAKEFTLEDFSCEQLTEDAIEECLGLTIKYLNTARDMFLEKQKEGKYSKAAWWQMIQLLPSSYNQKRTVQMNYEVLAAIYPNRKDHKLDEWHTFCDWIRNLPYSEIITLEEDKADDTE